MKYKNGRIKVDLGQIIFIYLHALYDLKMYYFTLKRRNINLSEPTIKGSETYRLLHVRKVNKPT